MRKSPDKALGIWKPSAEHPTKVKDWSTRGTQTDAAEPGSQKTRDSKFVKPVTKINTDKSK